MPVAIKNMLTHLIREEQQWKVGLYKQWDSIMGNLAQHVTIVKIYNETIVLGVYDSTWMQELHMLSAMLLKKINAHLDKPRIKKITLKTVVKRIKKTTKTKREKEKPTVKLSQKEQITLTAIEDPEMKSALKEFLVRCHTNSAQ